jgi:LysM repeat protein
MGTQAYIRQYKDIAIEEMKRVGIPASITLAQGIHESGIGKSYLAVNTNNHFGIKCHENWKGRTFSYTDDAPDECFRVYDSPEESYHDHSDFLANRPRYAGLFLFAANDYKAWAYGLKKAGYATNPKYPDILIKTIEDFQLYLFDKGDAPYYINSESVPFASRPPAQETSITEGVDAVTPDVAPIEEKNDEVQVVDPGTTEKAITEPYEKKIMRVNKRKAVRLSKGETPELIRGILGISQEDILYYNDVTEVASIKEGDLLFIQKKKRRNREGTYVVQPNDNMWTISQNKGVQLVALMNKNKLRPGEEPAMGETIYLRGQAPAKPKLKAKAEMTKEIVNAAEMTAQASPEISQPENTVDIAAPEEEIREVKAEEPLKPAAEPVKENTPTPEPTTERTMPAEPAAAPVTASTTEKTIYPAVIDYSKLPKSDSGFHLVVKGDTMYNICKRYGITTAQLMEWNNLPDQSVKLGQTLKITP